MAKALTGYLSSDQRNPALLAENSRLRQRVADLETLVLRLQEQNDALLDARAEQLLDTAPEALQPA